MSDIAARLAGYKRGSTAPLTLQYEDSGAATEIVKKQATEQSQGGALLLSAPPAVQRRGGVGRGKKAAAESHAAVAEMPEQGASLAVGGAGAAGLKADASDAYQEGGSALSKQPASLLPSIQVVEAAERPGGGAAAGGAGGPSGSSTLLLSPSRSASAAAAASYPTPGRKGVALPHPQWLEQLGNIKTMRASKTAPVDTMGCERCHDLTAPPHVQRYQILVSLMLSAQTKDEITYAATQKLLGHGFTPDKIAETPQEKLQELIYPVGFYKNKARYIKESTRMILDKFGGDIPDTVEGLMSLTGVGPKMAYIAMNSAWGKGKEGTGSAAEGIGVDTHVHRISNRLGWCSTADKGPEATRLALESWMPKEHWAEINLLLVGFGQEICQPVKPKCEGCLNRGICPVGQGLRSPAVTPKRK